MEVGPGAFLTGRVSLRTNCYLLLRPGGIVQGSSKQTDYGLDWDYWAIVVGRNVSNTGVIGPEAHDMGRGGEVHPEVVNLRAITKQKKKVIVPRGMKIQNKLTILHERQKKKLSQRPTLRLIFHHRHSHLSNYEF